MHRIQQPEMNIYMMTGILTMAAVWDLFYAKVPNGLITAGYMTALCSVLMRSGAKMGDCFFGLMLPYLTGMVFFAFGILGAGDLKLWSVVGAFLGVRAVLYCIGFAIVLGGVEGGLKIVLEAGRRRRYPQGTTIRFALPILCGTLMFLFWDPVGG